MAAIYAEIGGRIETSGMTTTSIMGALQDPVSTITASGKKTST